MSELFSQEPFASIAIVYGLVLLIIGFLFKKKPPKKINAFYGYRTPRSMKDQAHWDFAHKYSANLSIYLGLACMAAAPIGWILEFSESTESILGGLWILLVTASLIIRTEAALIKKFKL